MYDYYKILEIPRTAIADDIKQAYRIKAKLVHPDVNDSPKAHEIFMIVKEAYDVLIDDHKRYLYDVKLNYIDSAKLDAERKKHYYGSSPKNDSYTNSNPINFNYDWASFKTPQKGKTDEEYYKQSPLIYNLFFACGMFIGFMIVIITFGGIYRHYWATPFVLIAIPGFILIRSGWNGMMGKKTILSYLIKFLKHKKEV